MAAPRKPPAKSPEKEKNAIGATRKTSRQIKGLAEKTDAQDVDLVRETLRAICADMQAPAAARAQAARTLAEMAGALGRHAAPPTPAGKPLADMTREEMEAELAALGGS